MKAILVPPRTGLVAAVLDILGPGGKDFSSAWIVFPEKRPGYHLRKSLEGRERTAFVPPRIDSFDGFIGSGEVGVIASVTQAFCRTCNRARLSAEGKLYTCLFAVQGHDFRGLLRSGASDEELSQAIERVWNLRSDRYSELRSEKTVNLPKVEMSHIGG